MCLGLSGVSSVVTVTPQIPLRAALVVAKEVGDEPASITFSITDNPVPASVPALRSASLTITGVEEQSPETLYVGHWSCWRIHIPSHLHTYPSQHAAIPLLFTRLSETQDVCRDKEQWNANRFRRAILYSTPSTSNLSQSPGTPA